MAKIIFRTSRFFSVTVQPLYDMSPEGTEPLSVQGWLWAWWEWFGIHEQPCKRTIYADIYDAADIQMRTREIKRKLKYKYLRYNYLQVYLAPRMHLHVRYA